MREHDGSDSLIVCAARQSEDSGELTTLGRSRIVAARSWRNQRSAPWSPDPGDGTFRNPVLYADYSDPDAVRVGDDYYMVSSSFSAVPGLPILHSRDLVNWDLVNHALPRLVPEDVFARPQHGAGVWAPAIRHHAGKYWIYYPDPDYGIYLTTATDPRGAWSTPVLVKAGKGLIDPVSAVGRRRQRLSDSRVRAEPRRLRECAASQPPVTATARRVVGRRPHRHRRR